MATEDSSATAALKPAATVRAINAAVNRSNDLPAAEVGRAPATSFASRALVC